MNSLNKAQIIGNVTRDPELKTTQSGQMVATIGVASNRRWTDSGGARHDEAEYHNIVCWGKLAEIASQYLKKGTKVFFEGRLKTRNWEDESGVKHYRTEIVAEDMIILSPKGQVEPDFSGSAMASAPVDSNPAPASTGDEISPEDLPF